MFRTMKADEHVSCVAQKVPFSSDLPSLIVGKAICVSGVVQPKCISFAVNLTCGRTPSPDIAFHLNPRLLQRYVVRNTRIDDQWGKEERTSTVKFGFELGKKFNLTILVGDEEFLVALDGVHLFSYPFRVPLGKVSGIDIIGAVEISQVEYKQLEVYPEVIPENKPVSVAAGRRDENVAAVKTAMNCPVTFFLPRGFEDDCQLQVCGRVKLLPHSFYINLQEGARIWPHPIVPLHLNPRFRTGSMDPIFIRNAWVDGKWGQEERTPGFQFSPGSPFTVAIRRGDRHFSVWIDGQLAGEFKFRADVDQIDTVRIEGDVVVFDVFLDEKPDFRRLVDSFLM